MLISVACGWTAGLGLALAWTFIVTPLVEQGKSTDLVIPAGTAAAVSAGKPANFIPTQLLLGTNGKIHVVNNDVVNHIVAGKTVRAHSSTTIKTGGDISHLTCSLSPSGEIGVGFTRPPGPLDIFLMSTVVGLPIGALFGLIIVIAKKLDSGGNVATQPVSSQG